MQSVKLLGAGASSGASSYVDDVFSAYTYTGNGTSQTINTGIAIGSSIDHTIDPYFDKVSLLMHADGVNASTTFVDSSLTMQVLTPVGNALISTTQSKFGGTSAYFDGSGDLVGSTVASNSISGTGAYTVEAWIYCTNSAAVSQTIIGGATTDSFLFTVNMGTGSKAIAVNKYGTGAVNGTTGCIQSYEFSINTWYHVAAVRNSSNVTKLFVNGIQIGSDVTDPNNYLATSIGIGNTYSNLQPYTGYIDELRITKGIARYTSNFNVPAAAFPSYGAAVPNNITYTEAVVADAPVMYYRLNDTNSTAVATLGSNGTYRGTLYTQSATGGPTGTGFLTLDDSGTGMPGVTTGVTTNYTSAVTLEAWVKPNTQNDGTGTIIAKRSFYADAATDFPLSLAIAPTGIIYFTLSTGTDYVADLTLTYPSILNTWQHIAAVYRSSGLCELYLNGGLVSSGTISGSISSGSSAWSIGSSQEVGGGINGSTLNGGIAEVAIYNTALSAERIYLHSRLTNALSVIDHSVDPFISNNVLLVHANGINGSTTFTDSSTTAKTLTAVGNAQISTSQSKFGGSAVYFDGAGDYLTIPTHTDLSFGTGSFTIEGWFWIDSTSVTNSLLASRQAATTTGIILQWVSNIIYVYIGNGSSWVVSISCAAPTNNAWHHIAITREAANVYLHVDGVLSASSSAATGLNVGESTLVIGADLGQPGGSPIYYPMKGYIDELRITKGKARYIVDFNIPTVAFPDSAVIESSTDPYYSKVSLLIHADGTNGSTTFTDNGPLAKSLTTTGNAQVSTTQSKFGGASAYFDGNGDYIVTSNTGVNFASNNWTIEAFIYCTNSTSDAEIYANADAAGPSIFNFLRRKSNGTIRFYQKNSNAPDTVITDVTTTETIPINTWAHVAVVRISGTVSIYIHGVKCTISGTNLTTAYATPINNVYIGAGYAIGNYWYGYIDEFRITNGIARYTSNFTVPTSAFPNSAISTLLPSTNVISASQGLVWIKDRTAVNDHILVNTVDGISKQLYSNTTGLAGTSTNMITSLNPNGFSLGSNAAVNTNTDNFVSWTFKEAPKFFDIVTYTGNGANRTIAHNLGSVPGMIIIKRTDAAGGWIVYHRSLANTSYLQLQSTAAETTGVATVWNSTTPTSSVFSVGTGADVNANAGTFVAYIFAHNTDASGLIQCGTWTNDAGGYSPFVNLGFEPQLVIHKRVDSATNGDWHIVDNMRGMTAYTTQGAMANQPSVKPNSSAAESIAGLVQSTSTGFYSGGTADAVHIYLAIRRPNKPPTVGTQVYESAHYTGNGAIRTVSSTITADLVAVARRTNPAGDGDGYPRWVDRLRGDHKTLQPTGTDAEIAPTATTLGIADAGQTGFKLYATGGPAGYYLNVSPNTYAAHVFRRAPGVFDVVCAPTLASPADVPHGLGVAPELIILKFRDYADNWYVQVPALDANYNIYMNLTGAGVSNSGIWASAPSSATFRPGSAINGGTGYKYVAYLFATKAGISKVGTYTGNGSNQTINCGFTTGARFIMIKRTDSTGDWYIWDSTRGIIAGNDPHLSLNTTAAEVTTDDSIDPSTVGFIVNQVAATNINVTSATYIFLAIA